MFYSTGNDQDFAWKYGDHLIPEFHVELPLEDEEQLVRFVVLMPHPFALGFHQADLIVVVSSDDLRSPVFAELLELLAQVHKSRTSLVHSFCRSNSLATEPARISLKNKFTSHFSAQNFSDLIPVHSGLVLTRAVTDYFFGHCFKRIGSIADEVLRPPSFDLHMSVAIVRAGQLGALERAVGLLEHGIRDMFEAAHTR